MATVLWIGNAQDTQAVEQCTVTAVAASGTLVATINGKVISYMVTGSDTVTSAATAFFNLLNSVQTTPPEFNELSWANPSNGVVTATAKTAGTPFAGMPGGLVFSATGGCSVTQTTLTPNSSQSDVFDARNWLRDGVTGLPQNGDDMVLADSAVPLLWNLDKLAAIKLNSFTRWQSFTGTVGLPENNPNGYYEYRPTYFQFSGGASSSSSSSPSAGASGVLTMILGLAGGGGGSGPTRERYNVGSSQAKLIALAAGSPQDAYSIRFLTSNPASAVSVVNTSVGVAMLPGEVAAIASGSVDGGGVLALGPGCSISGAFTLTNGTGILTGCAPGQIVCQASSSLVQGVDASNPNLTYTSVTCIGGSRITWLSGCNVSQLVLQTSSFFDKSQDLRPMVVTDLTIDGDTCQVLDPNNTITFTNPVQVKNTIRAGPIVVGTGHTLKVG